MMKEFFICELVGEIRSTIASGKLFKMWLSGFPGTLPTDLTVFDFVDWRVGDLLLNTVPARDRPPIEACD